jgi:hypothetical protein
MPHPHQFDPPSRPSLLTCPDCFRPMRITVIEVDNGRQHIKLVCDDCRTEAIQDTEQ